MTYYWRIDTVDANGKVYTGDVWSFVATPRTAWMPKPADGTNFVAVDATLEWKPGAQCGCSMMSTSGRIVPPSRPARPRRRRRKSRSKPLTPRPDWNAARPTSGAWTRLSGADAVPGEIWSFTVQPVIEKADASLVGWWKMEDENADVAVDSSGYDHHGKLVAGPLWDAGYFGDALKFDGVDDYVDCGADESLALSGSVTIAAWVKSSASVNDGKIASNQNNVTGGYKLGIYQNKAEFEIRTAANTAVLNRSVAGGTTLEQGTWYHVVGVYSAGQSIRTYINGVLDRELVTADVLGASTGVLDARPRVLQQRLLLGRLDGRRAGLQPGPDRAGDREDRPGRSADRLGPAAGEECHG